MRPNSLWAEIVEQLLNDPAQGLYHAFRICTLMLDCASILECMPS